MTHESRQHLNGLSLTQSFEWFNEGTYLQTTGATRQWIHSKMVLRNKIVILGGCKEKQEDEEL